MAIYVHGTPLPVDSPTKLVVQGPYAYIRNPMAIPGLGQGFSVALFFSSIEITIHILVGLIIWVLSIKPMEESYLVDYFSNEFEHYKLYVKCWIPIIKIM